MLDQTTNAVTSVWSALRRGDAQTAATLLPTVYDELRRLAASKVATMPLGHTWQATDLVHEAYMRVVGDEDPGWDDRAHFFGAAARAMRFILVDRARSRSAMKNGGNCRRLGQGVIETAPSDPPVRDVLVLDDALDRLEVDHPRMARIVILRFFAGLTHDQIAELLDVSVATVHRDWRFARTWLQRDLADATP